MRNYLTRCRCLPRGNTPKVSGAGVVGRWRGRGEGARKTQGPSQAGHGSNVFRCLINYFLAYYSRAQTHLSRNINTHIFLFVCVCPRKLAPFAARSLVCVTFQHIFSFFASPTCFQSFSCHSFPFIIIF